MSVRIHYKIVHPTDNKSLPGTSAHLAMLNRYFPGGKIKKCHAEMLKAMNEASILPSPIWGALWELLEDLPDGTYIQINGDY